jgi:hypothetical protein
MRYYFLLYGLWRVEGYFCILEGSFCLLNAESLGVMLYEFIYARFFLKFLFLWNNLFLFSERRPTGNCCCWNSFLIRIRNEFRRAEHKYTVYTCSAMLCDRLAKLRETGSRRTRRPAAPVDKNLFAPEVSWVGGGRLFHKLWKWHSVCSPSIIYWSIWTWHFRTNAPATLLKINQQQHKTGFSKNIFVINLEEKFDLCDEMQDKVPIP